jgi:hypothetical protein
MSNENETRAKVNYEEMASPIRAFLEAISRTKGTLGISGFGKTRTLQITFGSIFSHIVENEPVIPYLVVKLPVPSTLDDETTLTNTTFPMEVIDEAECYMRES